MHGDRGPWRADVGGTVARLAAAGGMVHAGCGSLIHCLDAASGRELWWYDTGTPGPFRVAGGVVYATGGGRLRALDARTGAERWHCPGVIPRSPAVGAGRVCVLGDTPRWGRSLLVLDARTGAERWRIEAEVRLSAVVVDDLVVVGFADGTVVAFKARNGKARWRVEPDEWQPDWPERGGAVEVVAAGGGQVYVAGLPYLTPPMGFVAAVDAARGRVRWVTIATCDLGPERPDEGDAPVLAVPEGVWVGQYGSLALLDARTGAARANPVVAGARFSPPAVCGGLVVAGAGGRRVTAYESATGRPQWTVEVPLRAAEGPPVPVAVAGDRVVVGGVGQAYAVDAHTGKRV